MSDPTRTLLVRAGGIGPRTHLAAAGYLSRYTGTTLRSYSTCLDVYFRWMQRYNVDPLDAKRPQIELYVRTHLEEELGLKPTSIESYMTPVRGFYRYALVDDYINRNPAIDIRLPRIWRDPWREDWVNAAELRALVAAAKRSDEPSDQGLIALLALLGLRIAEVLGTQIEDYQETVTGHRVIRIYGKGGKPATLPLTVAILRMLDTAAGDRTEGPLLIRSRSSQHVHIGDPLTYRAARFDLSRLARDAGIERRITPHMLRRGFITHGLDQGISMRDMQIAARHHDPRTTARYDRGAQNLDGSAIHKLSASIAGGG